MPLRAERLCCEDRCKRLLAIGALSAASPSRFATSTSGLPPGRVQGGRPNKVEQVRQIDLCTRFFEAFRIEKGKAKKVDVVPSDTLMLVPESLRLSVQDSLP